MESSLTRDRTHVPCIGRQILIHYTTREVKQYAFIWSGQGDGQVVTFEQRPKRSTWTSMEAVVWAPSRQENSQRRSGDWRDQEETGVAGGRMGSSDKWGVGDSVCLANKVKKLSFYLCGKTLEGFKQRNVMIWLIFFFIHPWNNILLWAHQALYLWKYYDVLLTVNGLIQ